MNGPWRSLGAAWRHSPALAFWPHAVAGAREWQQVLANAAPRAMAIDAWPHEPDVALLLQPLAQSPLQAPLQVPLQAPLAGAVRTAPAAVARFATMVPAAPANAASPPRRWMGAGGETAFKGTLALHSVPAVSGSPGPDAGTYDRAAISSPSARATTPQPSATPARVAALLARFAAHQQLPLSGTAGAAPRPEPKSAWSPQERAMPAFGNVVPLRGAAGVQFKPRAAPDGISTANPALKLRHWSRVLGRPAFGALGAASVAAASAASEIVALLARGEQASFDAAAVSGLLHSQATSPLAAAAALRPTAPAVPPADPGGTAPTPAPKPARRGLSSAAGPDTPSAPAGANDSLASLSASMARIENQLAVSAQAAAPAPVAPQWLSDDDTLAERIHDILRRQARRHGIDTP